MSRITLLFLVWVSLNLTGCAAAVVAGAVGAGYLATDEEAGESVSTFFENIFSRKVSDTEKTRELLNYKDGDGLVIRLLDQSVRPKKVQAGKPITVTLDYAVMGAPKKGTVLRLRQSLWYKKKLLTVIFNRRFTRADGTWEDSFKINVPDTAQPGGYALGIIMSSADEPKIPQEKGHVVFYVKK
jgi:hypothetical protein